MTASDIELQTGFPTGFAGDLTPLPLKPGEPDRAVFERVHDAGFVVVAGITSHEVPELTAMANEPHIIDFCPTDVTARRFADVATTDRWLRGGRAMFLLMATSEWLEPKLAGYGWTGAKTTPEVPGGEATFAIRIGELGRGRRLALPFAKIITSYSESLYGARRIWLETWKSNEAATGIYNKLGFVTVQERDALRQLPEGSEADTRVFMQLQNAE